MLDIRPHKRRHDVIPSIHVAEIVNRVLEVLVPSGHALIFAYLDSRSLIRQRTMLVREHRSEARRVPSHRMTSDEAHDHEECRRGAATALGGL